MINVTRPFLPKLEDYTELVNDIWKRNWLTNNGPLSTELEIRIKELLNIENFLFLGNGTIAIQMAIQALKLKGDVITTPFSYVATTSSILWENCNPIFADIDEGHWNIDPSKIEHEITDNTVAILATHVFGNGCEVEQIEEIAKMHNLKVIYDAAHAFGVNYKGQSILNFGDISTLSFHATKLFHTIEGGAVVAKDDSVHEVLSLMRNFGHDGPSQFSAVGINGKNSEFHAAMGLCNLKCLDEIMSQRERQYKLYLHFLDGQNLQFQSINENIDYNYSYFPVVLESEEVLEKVVYNLNRKNIFPRRYFHPSINKISIFNNKQSMPISESISNRILCIPLFHELQELDQKLICNIIKSSL